MTERGTERGTERESDRKSGRKSDRERGRESDGQRRDRQLHVRVVDRGVSQSRPGLRCYHHVSSVEASLE